VLLSLVESTHCEINVLRTSFVKFSVDNPFSSNNFDKNTPDEL